MHVTGRFDVRHSLWPGLPPESLREGGWVENRLISRTAAGKRAQQQADGNKR